MLKKERWIVYPLLMLSLFSSLVGVQVLKAQQDVLDRVVTKELIIVNDNGVETATIKNTYTGSAELLLNDGEGENMVELSAHGTGASLTLNDRNHKTGIHLWAASQGGSLALSYDGNQQVDIVAHSKGPEIWLGNFPDPNTKIRHIRIGSLLEAGGYLNLYNEKGDEIVSIFQNTRGNGGIWLFDKYGEDSRSITY